MGPKRRSVRVAENLAPTGIRFWTVQPVARRYTCYVIPAQVLTQYVLYLHCILCYHYLGGQSVPFLHFLMRVLDVTWDRLNREVTE